MTKHVEVGVQPTNISDEMIEAGLAAYVGNASHDEMSFVTPRELVALILREAISHREAQPVHGRATRVDHTPTQRAR